MFDAAESRSMPLTRASLDQCSGLEEYNTSYDVCERALLLSPSKQSRKRRYEAVAADRLAEQAAAIQHALHECVEDEE